MKRIIVDCDPGHDDAVALVVAAHFGDLVGVTTVGGNAPLLDVTNNALLTCQIFGLDVEVHSGAERPLVAPPRNAPEVHGITGFKGPALPALERSVASTEAVNYLIETIRGEEGLWLAPTGPLTNIAMAFRQAPDLVHRVAGVSFMGGSATVGNHSAVAEFNILVDPEAAAIVLGSGAPLYMAGLDLTHQFLVDDSLVSELRAISGPGAVVLADLAESYLDQVELRGGERNGGLHDPCAIFAITHPNVIEHAERHVDVELVGTLTRGMTVVDQRRGNQGAHPNVSHGHTIDHHQARALVLEAVAARSKVGS